MVFRFSIPGPGKQKRNAEDLIVSTLAHDFPLTLQQIHNKIKKQFAVSVTYQAVRKSVNNLVDERILIKEGKNYLLNRNWILENSKIIGDIKRSYFELKKPKNEIQVGENVTEYTFSNLIEKDKIWCKIQEEWLKEAGSNDVDIWQGAHTWWLFGQLEHETRFIKLLLTKVKIYMLINGKTYLDKWSVNYYKKLGTFCTINKDKKIDNSSYLVVFGDYVMQTNYPRELVDRMEKFYEKTKKLEDMDLNEIVSIVTSENNIQVTLIKNKEIADRMRKDILRHF